MGSKLNKRIKSKLSISSNNAIASGKYDTSSTRSTSQSISPQSSLSPTPNSKANNVYNQLCDAAPPLMPKVHSSAAPIAKTNVVSAQNRKQTIVQQPNYNNNSSGPQSLFGFDGHYDDSDSDDDDDNLFND